MSGTTPKVRSLSKGLDALKLLILLLHSLGLPSEGKKLTNQRGSGDTTGQQDWSTCPVRRRCATRTGSAWNRDNFKHLTATQCLLRGD